MILYDNRSHLRLLLERRGSIALNSTNVIMGLFLAGVSVACVYMIEMDSDFAPKLPNLYAVSTFGWIVGFAIVFRTSLALQKYWGAIREVEKMYTKWMDVFTQYSVFARATLESVLSKGDEEAMARGIRVREIYDSLHKHFCLLSAFAIDRLSHGDLELMSRKAETEGWRQQVTTRSQLRIELGSSIDHAKFKASRPLPQFLERSQLGEQGDGWTNAYVVECAPSLAEVAALEESEDRVNTISTFIYSGFASTSKDLEIAAPIQSRMYQELSNASLAYMQAVELADTPFPFAHSQLLEYLIVIFSCFTPVVAAVSTHSYILAPVVSLAVFVSLWTLNQGALELEAPFGKDLNDIPLHDYHHRFCKGMIDVHKALNAVHAGKTDGVSVRSDVFLGASTSLLPEFEKTTSIADATAGMESKEPKGDNAAGLGFGDGSAARESQYACPVEPNTVEIDAGLRHSRATADGNHANDVFHRHLAQIGERMERHLAHIACEIDGIVRRTGKCTVPGLSVPSPPPSPSPPLALPVSLLKSLPRDRQELSKRQQSTDRGVKFPSSVPDDGMALFTCAL